MLCYAQAAAATAAKAAMLAAGRAGRRCPVDSAYQSAFELRVRDAAAKEVVVKEVIKSVKEDPAGDRCVLQRGATRRNMMQHSAT